MKITSIKAENIDPIKNIFIENLGNVVIIAGANGSGKTRLKEAIKNTFQNPSGAQLMLGVAPTREVENNKFASDIEVKPGVENQVLTDYMNTRTRGGTYIGTVIQIDSNRSVLPIKFQPINLSIPDPDDIEIDNKYYLSPFIGRWGQTVNKIFQKVANRDNKIADHVKSNSNQTNEQTLKKFPDPFLQYQELFEKLLPGKTLENIDPKQLKEFHYKVADGQPLPFNTLSSGEQEVIKIVFDLLWKKIRHSIFLIDEPELHLHPTLTFRLIETLKEMGGGTNQFIFFTHSADLISTYYSTGNVYFIDANADGSNQAHRLSDLKNNHPELTELMSENLGLFAVGKKLVFVEGKDSSIDRLTYHSIAQKYTPELNFISVGSVENILLIENTTKQLNNSLFGIDFYMIRDRDGLNDDQINALENDSSLRCIKRRHIENYFLDPEVLAKVAARFCLDEQWQNKDNIGAKLEDIAKQSIVEAFDLISKEYLKTNLNIPVPSPKDIQSKQIEQLIEEFKDKTNTSISNINNNLTGENLKNKLEQFKENLENSLNDNTWKNIFPGKVLFRKFCTEIKVEKDRVRQAYIEIALEEKPSVFQDIKEILESFNN